MSAAVARRSWFVWLGMVLAIIVDAVVFSQTGVQLFNVVGITLAGLIMLGLPVCVVITIWRMVTVHRERADDR